MSKQFLSEKETKNLYQKACRVIGGESKRLCSECVEPSLTNLVACDNRACFVNIISDDSSPENFDAFLETVNKNLKPLYMKIRRGVSEEDGSSNYGLVWQIWNVKLIRKKSGYQTSASSLSLYFM